MVWENPWNSRIIQNNFISCIKKFKCTWYPIKNKTNREEIIKILSTEWTLFYSYTHFSIQMDLNLEGYSNSSLKLELQTETV